jgi:ribosomal protein S12 methylthiotransferase accessory factor
MMTERELNTEEAIQRLDALVTALGLHAILSPTTGTQRVATCQLYDAQGDEVACGAGKGEACTVGALAESLEHYVIDITPPNPTTSDQILTSLAPFDDWLLSAIPPGCQVPSFTFEGLKNDAPIDVPAVLVAPSARQVSHIERTAAGFLSKYASNSGMALGCTRNEALLHAVNEAVERHALSMYYLALCGLAPAPRLYRPSRTFLRETFMNDSLLLEYADDLDIFLTHDFFDLPFCIAVSRPTAQRPLGTVGSGSSLSPAVALYRAVTEHLQCEHLYGPLETQEDHATAALLNSAIRLTPLVHPCPAYTIDAFHPPSESLSVSRQIECLSSRLNNCNKRIFSRTVFEHTHLATVMQVYVPGLERFHLIRAGVPVAPQGAFACKRSRHAGA